jgi:DNA-binding transcriptional LysR family regulator
MPEGFGTYFLAPRLERFTAQHPQLEVEIVANPRMFSLSKREAEIAVTMTRPQQGRLHARKLTDYELGLYACRAYLETRGPIEHRAQIASHPWIGYIKDLIWTSELDYFVDISKSIVPRVKISNVITQMTAILGGTGLGVLPCFMASREADLIRLLPKEIRIIRSYWLVIHSDVRDLVRVKAVADFVADRVQAERQFFWPAGEMPSERKTA